MLLRRFLPILMLAVGLSGSVARASITPDARAIVNHYLEATGGVAVFQAQQTLHLTGRINTMEFKGSFESWSEPPNRFLRRMSLGPLRTREGFDGTTGWRTDLNSKQVTILDGHDLESMRSDAYFENEMWAREGQGGGSVTRGTSALRDNVDYVSLDVKPPTGEGRRLWFNAKTGLPNRVVTRGDNVESDEWYSEYKTLGGRVRPTLMTAQEEGHRITWTRHEEPDAESMIVDSAWAGPTQDPARFAPPADPRGPLTWLKTPGVASVPFRYGTQHVWIRASINGAPPADFLLDTGCSSTAIDGDYADQIGLKREGRFTVQGMGGYGEASFGRVATLRVGSEADGVTLRDLKVGIIDLGGGHEEVMWRKMAGLVGYDFLSRFVVELDYDKGIVTFRDPATFAYAGKGKALDMQLMSGVPIVQATLGDSCTGDFLVDVGNFGFDLHGSLVRRCQVVQAMQNRKQVQEYGVGVGDFFRNWVCRVDSLSLGPYRLRQPTAAMSLSRRGMVGSEQYAGNIGNSVLEHFKVTFDYAHRKLYLEPGARFAERDRHSLTGTMFVKQKFRVIVGGVLHGSPADEAGLKQDDEVLLIDGEPALSFTPEKLDRLFVRGEIGSIHRLSIMREGKPKTVEMKLADLLDSGTSPARADGASAGAP